MLIELRRFLLRVGVPTAVEYRAGEFGGEYAVR